MKEEELKPRKRPMFSENRDVSHIVKDFRVSEPIGNCIILVMFIMCIVALIFAGIWLIKNFF